MMQLILSSLVVSLPIISSFSSFPSFIHSSSRLYSLNNNNNENPLETNNDATNPFNSLKTKSIKTIKTTLKVGASLLGIETLNVLKSNAKDKLIWKKVDLPTRETLFDISFDPKNPSHGWLVGAKGTFLETFDSGIK